jgi:hypothetical protein
MNEDMNNHLTPEVLKEMAQIYSSKVFKKVAIVFAVVACAAVVIALTGCTTTASLEQDHCGNSVKTILCKNPM